MKPEEQNIAIARACGREFHKPTEEELKTGSYYQYEPDFTRDLNAMHVATSGFTLKETMKFSDQLKNIMEEEQYVTSAVDARYWTVNATAAQRAKAFLKAKGLWTGDE